MFKENYLEKSPAEIQKAGIADQVVEAIGRQVKSENQDDQISPVLTGMRPLMRQINSFRELGELYQQAGKIDGRLVHEKKINGAQFNVAETVKYLVSIYADKLMRSQPIDENLACEIADLHNVIIESEAQENPDSSEKIFSILYPMENQMQALRLHGEKVFNAYREHLNVQKMIDQYFQYFLYYWCRQGKEHWVEARLEAKNDLELPDYLHIFSLDKTYAANKILEFLTKNELDDVNIKLVIITLTDLLSAETARQKINQAITKETNQNVINNLEYARAFFTPNHDKIAMKSVEELYQKINFKEYGLNKEMNNEEIKLLESLTEKVKNSGQVLDMGCGTGRLMLAMKQAGYDIIGYDLTEEHLKEIKKDDRAAKVFRGDWHNNAIKDQSFDAVYSLGRNILHDYALPNQLQLFREAARVLKPGGRFIFDIPDRDKGGIKGKIDIYVQAMEAQKKRELTAEASRHAAGGYKQAVEDYKKEMEKRGVRNYRVGTIYDSPDGINFMTRYVYSRQDIAELARLAGFKIVSVTEKELPTGKGDVNLYYVLEKI